MMAMTQATNKQSVIRGILFTMLVNGLIPLVVYELLLGYTSSVMALTIATMIPLLDNAVSLIRHRRVDVFASFMLIGFVLSLLAVFMGGSERLILLRESFVTAVLGFLFLGSLLFSRPLIYHFAIRFTVGNDPVKAAEFASNWAYPYFRFVLRLMTIVWGCALLGEALVRTFLVFQLSVPAFLAISNFVVYGFIGAAVVWTVLYRRHSAKRLQTIKLGHQ